MRTWRHIKHNMLRTSRRVARGNGINLFPFVGTLKRYNKNKFNYDIRAAINVALLAMPQGMAYAAIAEIPIVYGVICSALAALVAPFFSSSRHTILGPTNATALMVFSFFVTSGLEMDEKLRLLPLLVFMVGIFSVAGSFLKVADLLQYVSRSVLVGYISGAAILIISNQFKHLLGIAPQLRALDSHSFVGNLQGMCTLYREYLWQPFLIGGLTLALFFLLQKKFRALPNFAITLTAISVLSYFLTFAGVGFDQVATFQSFSPESLKPQFPDFASSTIFNDISILMAAAFAIAFLASLENTSMAKSLASRTSDRVDLNQDMFSVGMANIACSFVSGMPSSGSLTRSALNYESGAQTRFASFFCGLICLGGTILLAFIPLVQFIPKAALAALVIAIALSLFNPHAIRICLRSTSDDALVLLVTFVATLLSPLYVAIFIGVALSITLFLRKASQPHLIEYEMNDEGTLRELGERRERPNPAISIVHVEGDLFFGAAELFRTQIQRTIADPNLKVIILRLKNAHHLDATSVMALEDLFKQTRRKGRHIIISGATRDVYRVLKQSGVLQTVQEGCDRSKRESNIFMHSPSNPNLSTRDALKRSQQLLGTDKADIKIYFDPNKDK